MSGVFCPQPLSGWRSDRAQILGAVRKTTCRLLASFTPLSDIDLSRAQYQALGKWKNHFTNVITQADATAHVANAALQNSCEAQTLSKGLLPVLEVLTIHVKFFVVTNLSLTVMSRLGHVLACLLHIQEMISTKTRAHAAITENTLLTK
eukprot:774825-Amphidinium_carterae.1